MEFENVRVDRPQVRDTTTPQVATLRPRMHSDRQRRDIANLLTLRREGSCAPRPSESGRPSPSPLPVHPKASKILIV